MPTDERPLRDVLREVEEDTRVNVEGRNDKRLARELRALAPLLRLVGSAATQTEVDRAHALADELEA